MIMAVMKESSKAFGLIHCLWLIAVVVGLWSTPVFAHNMADRFILRHEGKATTAPFYDLDGQKHHIKEFKGKYVLLTFWAMWCRNCLLEMPYLENLARQFRHDNFVVLAINRPTPGRKFKSVSQYRLESGLVSIDFFQDLEGDWHKEYGIEALPTAILIDPKGQVIGRHEGAVQWNHKDFILFFQDMLDGKLKIAPEPSLWERLTQWFKT